jgi:hypothetical protein
MISIHRCEEVVEEQPCYVRCRYDEREFKRVILSRSCPGAPSHIQVFRLCDILWRPRLIDCSMGGKLRAFVDSDCMQSGFSSDEGQAAAPSRLCASTQIYSTSIE